MFDRQAASAVSREMLATLGENRVAYIKAIRSEEVAFLSADAPLLAHAADGTPMLIADSLEAAMANAASREIETVSLH